MTKQDLFFTRMKCKYSTCCSLLWGYCDQVDCEQSLIFLLNHDRFRACLRSGRNVFLFLSLPQSHLLSTIDLHNFTFCTPLVAQRKEGPSLACEQALLFGRVKRVSRESASERQSREGQKKGEIYKRSLQTLLSSAPRSCVLARLASLAQIGELACRLDHHMDLVMECS